MPAAWVALRAAARVLRFARSSEITATRSHEPRSPERTNRLMKNKHWTTMAAAAALLVSPGAVALAQQPQYPSTPPGATSPPATTSPGMSPSAAPGSLAPLSDSDRRFLMEATRGSEQEVQFGELAKEKAQSNSVKSFGARMVADHGRAVAELKQLAARKGIRIGDTKITPEQPSFDRLTKLSKPEFDREYVNTMVQDHEKDVAEFRRMAEQAQDSDIKAWASRTLPTLEDHLKTIKSIQSTEMRSAR